MKSLWHCKAKHNVPFLLLQQLQFKALGYSKPKYHFLFFKLNHKTVFLKILYLALYSFHLSGCCISFWWVFSISSRTSSKSFLTVSSIWWAGSLSGSFWQSSSITCSLFSHMDWGPFSLKKVLMIFVHKRSNDMNTIQWQKQSQFDHYNHQHVSTLLH